MIYWGESSRSFYERGKEHLDSQMNENDNNPLYKHGTNDHDSIKQEYTIEVIETHWTALRRQLAEWLLIIKGRITGTTMNSKYILGLIALNYIMLPAYRDL